MTQTVAHNPEREVSERSQAGAESSERRLEEAVKSILKDVPLPDVPMARLTPDIERVRARFQDRVYSDSAALLREDRDR